MPRSRLVSAAVVAGSGASLVAATIGATAIWRRLPESRRTRARRSLRVWRLTARRATHFAVMKATGVAVGERRRQELEDRFAVATAEDIAAELGQMKGVLMKVGQLASVIADGLPDEARAALAQLQADVPPMAPSVAEGVLTADLGAPPDEVFLDFELEPIAAASIGQVHRAVTRDGQRVAVKVQYPGVADAIRADLDNAEMLYGMLSAVALPGLEPAALVEELRARMGEELDYRLEARNQQEFVERYRGHPWIRIPEVRPDLSGEHVLTSDWCDGRGFAEIAGADEATRQHIAEVVFRFAQSSVLRYRSFNGDPHPGNYRFVDDGTVVFLDFGLVKQWPDDEFAGLMAVLRPVLDQDPETLVEYMVDAGFLARDHRLSAEQVWASVSAPYEPYFHEEFTFTPSFAAGAMRTIADPTGPNRAVMRALNLPGSFVIVNRVLWGMGGLLGQLGATNRWRAILEEYLFDAPASTPMGVAEAAWRADRQRSEVGR